MTSRTNH